MSKLVALFLASRPKTLTAALVPILVSVRLAKDLSPNNRWWLLPFIFLSAACIQIATNLINDWADFKTGADAEDRLGPQRATQQGWLSEKTVFVLGFSCFVLAGLFGLPLVLVGGWPILLIGLLSVLAGYAYTAGPYPLAYHGLGDIFVIVFFGLVAVTGTTYLLAGIVNVATFIVALEVGLLSTALIAINNWRDQHQDKRVGKKTLAVKFGNRFAKLEIFVCLVAPVVLHLTFIEVNRWDLFSLIMLLPLSVLLGLKIGFDQPSERANVYLALAAAHQMAFGLIIFLGVFQ